MRRGRPAGNVGCAMGSSMRKQDEVNPEGIVKEVVRKYKVRTRWTWSEMMRKREEAAQRTESKVITTTQFNRCAGMNADQQEVTQRGGEVPQ